MTITALPQDDSCCYEVTYTVYENGKVAHFARPVHDHGLTRGEAFAEFCELYRNGMQGVFPEHLGIKPGQVAEFDYGRISDGVSPETQQDRDRLEKLL